MAHEKPLTEEQIVELENGWSGSEAEGWAELKTTREVMLRLPAILRDYARRVAVQRPTIYELEELLDRKDLQTVVLPNGEIRTVPIGGVPCVRCILDAVLPLHSPQCVPPRGAPDGP